MLIHVMIKTIDLRNQHSYSKQLHKVKYSKFSTKLTTDDNSNTNNNLKSRKISWLQELQGIVTCSDCQGMDEIQACVCM